MLYEFKSRATGTVIMTQSVGDLVMKALGREPSAQGVITVEQIPGAVAALKAAAHAEPEPRPEDADDDADDEVAFSARVMPLIEMLERSGEAGKNVTWGV
jgi:cyclopropane-fatty-acyl-phospholipid synthase